MKAFLLLQTEPGAAPAVAARIARLEGVVSAVVTSGAFDVVVEVEVADANHEAMVREAVRGEPGLHRVCACQTAA